MRSAVLDVATWPGLTPQQDLCYCYQQRCRCKTILFFATGLSATYTFHGPVIAVAILAGLWMLSACSFSLLPIHFLPREVCSPSDAVSAVSRHAGHAASHR